MAVEAGLRLERRGPCAWVTLDRPPLNLLEPGLIAGLERTFLDLAGDRTVRAAVVTGAGRLLTGGMQLQVLRDLDQPGAKALITSLARAIQAVHEAPFPTVCAINGACLGGGLELALACDLRVAAESARLGLPEIRVGIPSVIHAALLPTLIGPGRAAELLLTGESVTAETALAWGLVNRVVPAERLTAETEALLEQILRCAPTAVRLQKELLVAWRQLDLGAAIEVSLDLFARAYATGEPREAMQAYLDKRPPRFD